MTPSDLHKTCVDNGILRAVAKRAKLSYGVTHRTLLQDPPSRADHLVYYTKRLFRITRAIRAELLAREQQISNQAKRINL